MLGHLVLHLGSQSFGGHCLLDYNVVQEQSLRESATPQYSQAQKKI